MPSGRARLAYRLLLQVGQSKCDVVRMGRQHVRNGTVSSRRQKTGVPFDVPIVPALQVASDEIQSGDSFVARLAQGRSGTTCRSGLDYDAIDGLVRLENSKRGREILPRRRSEMRCYRCG